MIYNLGDVVRCNYSLFSVKDVLCEIVVICEEVLAKKIYYGIEQIAEPNVPSINPGDLKTIDASCLTGWLNSRHYIYTHTAKLGDAVGLWPQEKHLTLVRRCVFSTAKVTSTAKNRTIICNNPFAEIPIEFEFVIQQQDDDEDHGGLAYL